MNKSQPVWLHKTDFNNSTVSGDGIILAEEYFHGVSQANLLKTITHTYDNNITEMRAIVGKYIGHIIHPSTPHSKVREAYTRIKQTCKFITVHEILKIIK